MEWNALCYNAQNMGKTGTETKDRWATGYLVTPPKAVPQFPMSKVLSCNKHPRREMICTSQAAADNQYVDHDLHGQGFSLVPGTAKWPKEQQQRGKEPVLTPLFQGLAINLHISCKDLIALHTCTSASIGVSQNNVGKCSVCLEATI